MRPRKPHDAPSHWPPGSGPGCVPADLQRHTPKSTNLSHQMTSPAQGPRRSGSARSIPGTSVGGLSPPDRPWLASPSPSSGRRGPSLQWGPPSSTPTKPPMLTKGCGGVASPLPLTPPGSASGSNLGDTAGWVGMAETSGAPLLRIVANSIRCLQRRVHDPSHHAIHMSEGVGQRPRLRQGGKTILSDLPLAQRGESPAKGLIHRGLR